MKNKFLGWYLEAFISDILFFLPVYSVVFYTSIGLSLAQIGILIAVNAFAGFIFEIPTGVFADKFGRKNSILFGYVIVGLAYFTIFYIHTFEALLILSAIVGFGHTFVSGAWESWVSDLVSKKKVSIMFARIDSFSNAGKLIAGFLGVVLVSLFGLDIIWLAASLSYLLGAIFYTLVPASNTKSKDAITWKEYVLHLKKSLAVVKKNVYLKRIMLAFCILGLAYSFSTNLAWIAFFQDLGFSENNFGYLWSLLSAVGIIAPYAGQYLERKTSTLFSMRLLLILWIVALASLLIVQSIIPAIIVLGLTALFDLARLPVERSYSQSLLPQKEKSTITSLQALVFSVGMIVGFPLAGFLADLLSPKFVLLFSAVLLIPILWFYRN